VPRTLFVLSRRECRSCGGSRQFLKHSFPRNERFEAGSARLRTIKLLNAVEIKCDMS